ncbi:hypothetical protein EBR04_00730 [bacterium]|nr:hypothetical protein [bacterium]
MPSVDLTSDQVIELVQQLPLAERQKAIAVLVEGLVAGVPARSHVLAAAIRAACESRGVAWEALSDEARERFVDDLIHESRSCRS